MHKVYISKDKISKRVSELGKLISEFARKSNISPLHVLWVAEGALIFVSDLIREIDVPLDISSIKISSYLDSQTPLQKPRIFGDLQYLKGKDVLIVDDIIDTGETIFSLKNELERIGVTSIKTCFLLNKKIGKEKKVIPDFKGFDIENSYVYGYGLDKEYMYRNLPEIYIV